MSKTKSLPRGIYKRTVAGSTSFLVSLGRDQNGKQRWKSCPTLDEAKTQRELFKRVKFQQGESLWLLTPEQRADAVAALDALKDYRNETLVAAVAHYVKTHLSLNRGQTLAALGEQYLREHKENWDKRTLTDARSNLNKLIARFGRQHPNMITVDDIKAWDKELVQAGLGKAARKNIHGRASSFFRWLVALGFAFKTPLDPVAFRRPRIGQRPIKFFTVDQCKTILQVFSKHGLLNYAVLGLFCGIRPEECRRLKAKHFKVDGDRIVITLDADVTKTVWRRVIELPTGEALGDCVWAWLGDNDKLELPENIAPCLRTFKKKFHLLRDELGFP